MEVFPTCGQKDILYLSKATNQAVVVILETTGEYVLAVV